MEKQNSNRNGEDEVDEIVETLLDQPVGNLEERIKRIENELGTRQVIFDAAIEMLGTHRIQLKDDLDKLWYSSLLGLDFGRRAALEQELFRTRNNEMVERLDYFKDASKLRERLQEAKEELALEREKRRLVK